MQRRAAVDSGRAMSCTEPGTLIHIEHGKHEQQKMEVVPPAEEPEEMPLPSDPKVIFLGGLFASRAAGCALCSGRDCAAISPCRRHQASCCSQP